MTLHGADALKAAIQRNPELVRSHMSTVIARTATAVAQRARASAPVATGALRQSIGASSRGLSGRVDVAAGTIQGQRPELYWRFIEYGTVKMPARPLFRAATEAEFPFLEQRVRAIVPLLERDFSAGRLL